MQRSIVGLILCLLLPWAAAGCSNSLEAQVSGIVTLDGKPLEGATVAFQPAGTGTSAYGSSDAEGHYSVKTGQGQGMLPGEYVVIVKKLSEVEPPAPGDPAVEVLPEVLSPKKYARKDISPLKFTVTAGEQTIDLPLTSE